MTKKPLSYYAWLSIVTALFTIALKTSAYLYTNSISIFSDALESSINLVAAILALWMIKVSERPPDHEHEFGHDKAAYFSSGIEGTLISLAAIGIIYTAAQRLFAPPKITDIDIGLTITFIAALLNMAVGQILIKAGKENDSIVLEADGRHLMTDVITSAGIFIGIVIVWITDWQILDPIIAIVVGLSIAWAGYQLVKRSVMGLMDSVIDEQSIKMVTDILNEYRNKFGIQYHALRTRKSGAKKFIYFHLLVPDDWTVKKGHDLTEEIELTILEKVSNSAIFIHLEPLKDPTSLTDTELFR